MHNVSQWPNLRHLGESLGGAEGLLEAVSFKKATIGVGRGNQSVTLATIQGQLNLYSLCDPV